MRELTHRELAIRWLVVAAFLIAYSPALLHFWRELGPPSRTPPRPALISE